MSDIAQEKIFQNDILRQMQAQGWLLGESKKYDRSLALYPEDVIAYIKNSQPKQWEKLCKNNPNPEQALLKSIERNLKKHGTLKTLRQPFRDKGAKLNLCSFKPDHSLNPDTLERYQQNIFRVVEELTYSPSDYDGRIDLVLFINGIPIATCELKSEFKQSLEKAKIQYMRDRSPYQPGSQKPEPLLTFKRGALVHFAVSQYNVAMTTHLKAENTFFLPFDQGTHDGGAGNDPRDDGQYPTAYLWQEIFDKDNLLLILGRYIHLETKEVQDTNGIISTKETLIFPRYHQWAVVNKLLNSVEQIGTGRKYLIQHSAGSGKSNSIAWLAHQLASKHYSTHAIEQTHPELNRKMGDKIFDSVIVVTDRTVLDSQLQDTIYQFEHHHGMIARINPKEAQGSKSNQLAKELKDGTSIIIVTIQTFPFVLDAIREDTSLANRSFAIIADEAHSSQTGTAARKLREVLMAESLVGDSEIDQQDILEEQIKIRGGSNKISYFAFTATPKAKTLMLFGDRPNMDFPPSETNKPFPFHVYSMRQAIEEGFILDVLQNYTSYSTAYKLGYKNSETHYKVDGRRAATKLAKWVKLHPHNIAQKVQVIIEHFNQHVKHQLGGDAKAMVVTSGRLEAVRYFQAFNEYIRENQYQGINTMVAFSGEVTEPNAPDTTYTENSLNTNLHGRDMRKAFDSNDYQVMLVANKFQTGFDQPKLVAMYVDKKLQGVECIQTLSRLNRIYPGKDQTFVLDFVNKPEKVLEEFKVYYQTAELSSVSDPNIIYEIFDKLEDAHIYEWQEVEDFAIAYYKDNVSQAKLINLIKPIQERFNQRKHEALNELKRSQTLCDEAEKIQNEKAINFAQNQLENAKKSKNALIEFIRNLSNFSRYYEFISQVLDIADQDLEQLNVFAKYLRTCINMDEGDAGIDLSDVVMTHYRLSERRKVDLILEENAGAYLPSAKTSTGATVKTVEHKYLDEVIEQINDLFADEGLNETDALNYINTIKDTVCQNQSTVEQVFNNSKEQAMLGEFPKDVQTAIINSLNAHTLMAEKALSDERLEQKIASIVYDLIRQSETRTHQTQYAR